MSVANPGVSIDEAHAALVYGLVRAHKPRRILEFGFGGGASANAIMAACRANEIDACYTLVDNWIDWGGVRPANTNRDGIEFVCADEWTFVKNCDDQFDFIMSDADHIHTHRWFEDVYDALLAPGGVLIYHDCCNFPGIAEIVTACERERLRHVVFDKCSVDGEACQRGILVIFKPVE